MKGKKMYIPFTYSLYHIPTKKYYYGVRFKKNCHPDDLWTKYFSSSKQVHKLIEEYGIYSFKVKVRKTFKTAKSARNWEFKILRKLKVVEKNNWLNKTYGKIPTTKGFKYSEQSKKLMSEKQKGKNNPMFGKTHTDEAREKISKAHMGKILKESTKQKISESKKGKPFSGYGAITPELNKQRSEKLKGHYVSEDSKRKMRESRLRYIALKKQEHINEVI